MTETQAERKRERERHLRFNECAQPGPCILETVWRGLFGTRTRRLPQTKQDSSGVSNLHNCEEMSCHGGLCSTKQLFQAHSHILGACMRLSCVN